MLERPGGVMNRMSDVCADFERVESCAVEIDALTVEFSTPEGGINQALSDIHLKCMDGEFLAIVGKSGCGKTTILNVLSGLVEPTAGKALVLGKPPRDSRREVGYMFARDALMPWRTAARNVELAMELQNIERNERRERARAMLKRVGLADAVDMYPWQLSHGMRQRVALARTWVMNPKVLLMDEPFAALDAQTRLSIREQFLKIWEADRKGVVFVTHDLAEALVLADRVIVISSGKVELQIDVPFLRPRNEFDIRSDPRFAKIEREVWRHLA